MFTNKISGRRRRKRILLQWRVGEYTVDFLTKLEIEIIVRDEDVSKALNAIVRSARRGGYLSCPVEGVVRIRIGDEGENAI